MNKGEFLKGLEKELIHQKCEDITSIIEYYDELIEDKKESGSNENDIIDSLSVSDIVRNVKIERKIDDAVQKPSISNGMKALIAFLGVLSFPMLITVGALIFALVVVILAVIFTVVVTFGALLFAVVVSLVAFIGALIFGKLPFFTALFGIGTMLLFTGIFSILVKWTIIASQEIMAWLMKIIKTKFRKEVKNNE